MLTLAPLVPPYGQEEVPELKSIFEMRHLRQNEVFLDTQCTSIGGVSHMIADYLCP
jgi:hypothetical protein